jgi:hypothetical protein
MDWQAIAIGALGILSASYGWFISGIVRDQKTLEKSLADFKDAIAEKYVRKDDFKIHAERLESMIQRLIDKLDGKADKA